MPKTSAHPGRCARCALVALIVTIMLLSVAGALMPRTVGAPVLLAETVSLRTAPGAPVAVPAVRRLLPVGGVLLLSGCALAGVALALTAFRLPTVPGGPLRVHALAPFSPVLRI